MHLFLPIGPVHHVKPDVVIVDKALVKRSMADLQALFPSVKKKHLRKAFAMGLGFQSYEDLVGSVKSNVRARCAVCPDGFAKMMSKNGWDGEDRALMSVLGLDTPHEAEADVFPTPASFLKMMGFWGPPTGG